MDSGDRPWDHLGANLGHTHTHTRTYTYTLTHMHARAYTHTHIHTHTYNTYPIRKMLLVPEVGPQPRE